MAGSRNCRSLDRARRSRPRGSENACVYGRTGHEVVALEGGHQEESHCIAQVQVPII